MVPPSHARDPIVGIDLGTTFSLVAAADASGPRVLRDEQGRGLLPSVVRYEAGGVVVGERARAEAPAFPRATVSSAKRLMGRGRADVSPDEPFLPYRVVEGENQTARIELDVGGRRVVSPQEVSAEILVELRRRASRALGVEVRRAVVTVPAYFDDAQRQATRDAGRLAGLEVVRIVNEPTAAALAYGLGAPTTRAMTIVVFDLGGGTFDVTVLRRIPASDDHGLEFFQVLATAGDTRLGGDDVDHMLVDLVLRELGGGVGPADLARALQAAERAKRELSDAESATIRFECMGAPVSRPITRAEFESLIEPWVDRAMACTRRALADAARRAGGTPAIDAVILVGGSTRIPRVRRRVAEAFGIEPYTAINPDEAVALGAAVQARILSGAPGGMLLLDVVPLSLGIETVGGAVAKLVMRNSTVPSRALERFSTSVDNQTSIRLSVFQGEREMAADCRKLGEFHLRGLPPMPAGIPRVEVEFLVDASGILNVSAVERRSGKRAALQVVPSHGLSRDEVDRLERESIRFASEDMTRHRVVDLVANATLDLKWIGERFERLGSKLEPAQASDLAARIDRLRELVRRAEADWTSVDPDAMHREKEELDRASVRLQEIGIAESLRDEGREGGAAP